MNIFKALTRNVVKWWQFRIMPVFRLDNNRMPGQQIKQENPAEQNPDAAQQNASASSSKPEPIKVGGEDAMEVLNRINREREEARRREIEKARMIAEEKARIAAIMNANKVDVDSFIEAGKEAYAESQGENGADSSANSAGDAAMDGNMQVNASDGNVQVGSADGNIQVSDDEEARKQEELRRAQEIIDRLNREAAEDEAKKEAEVAAAMQEAAEKFGS